MRHRHNPIHESHGPGWHVFRRIARGPRVRILILLAGAAALSFGIADHFSDRIPVPDEATSTRMPIANSLLEPDRPDLIGEPRIDE